MVLAEWYRCFAGQLISELPGGVGPAVLLNDHGPRGGRRARRGGGGAAHTVPVWFSRRGGRGTSSFLVAWGRATRGLPMGIPPVYSHKDMSMPRPSPRIEFDHHRNREYYLPPGSVPPQPPPLSTRTGSPASVPPPQRVVGAPSAHKVPVFAVFNSIGNRKGLTNNVGCGSFIDGSESDKWAGGAPSVGLELRSARTSTKGLAQLFVRPRGKNCRKRPIKLWLTRLTSI